MKCILADVLLMLLLAGCASDPQTTRATPTPSERPPAEQVLQALKWQDWPRLAEYVHAQGLRFTPYGYVTDADRKFTREQVRRLRLDSTIYEWGTDYASDEKLQFGFQTYYQRYIYDRDYQQAPQQGMDTRLGVGNTIDNTRAYYPGSRVVEYHFPGSGSDWSSLRLVFMRDNGVWRLAGIVHDQPTI